jgi:predicted DCC family thiol-disulfide oxidoreductase YuxK
MHPLFIYDGDCSFCRFWLERWRKRTGDRVEYEPYQKVATQFPQIPKEEFVRAAKLIEADGKMYSGAAAVLRLWTYRSGLGKLWWWSYRHVPLFAASSEMMYRFVARHRSLFWKLTKIFFSK